MVVFTINIFPYITTKNFINSTTIIFGIYFSIKIILYLKALNFNK